jgi:FkbM family methyltransferase
VPATERLAYLPRKYAAIAVDARQVTFLGRPFHYDNRLMPALLQGYPREIARLDRYVHFASATRVMDVGANVGQFAFTLKTFFPHVTVVSFEPNPDAFALLHENTAQHSGWRALPFGLARTAQSSDFYVVEGKSAQGSLYAENATLDLLGGASKTIQVRLEQLTDATLAAYDLASEYDFVKIDVEGFELDVLASLDRVRWRYLYLELSLRRAGGSSLDEVMRLVERTSGRRPRVVHAEPVASGASHMDVILASE